MMKTTTTQCRAASSMAKRKNEGKMVHVFQGGRLIGNPPYTSMGDWISETTMWTYRYRSDTQSSTGEKDGEVSEHSQPTSYPGKFTPFPQRYGVLYQKCYELRSTK